MRHTARPTRAHRTITVAFPHDAPSGQLLGDGTAGVACIVAVLRALGCPLTPKARGRGGGCRTPHAHDRRARLGGRTSWHVQCPPCNAVCTVLPHVVWRSRSRPPAVAREALVATPGGRSFEGWAGSGPLSPMARSRRVGALGQHRLMTVLTRCGLARPPDVRADEPHRRCLTDQGSRPTVVSGRVSWPRGASEEARAAALTEAAGAFQRAALPQEPGERVPGVPTEGFASTPKRRRTRVPGGGRGHGLRHALTKLPKTLVAIASPGRPGLRSPCHTLVPRARQRKGCRGWAWGQRVRRVADHVAATAGAANGARGRQGGQDTKAGGSAVLADPRRPVTSPLVAPAHHASERP